VLVGVAREERPPTRVEINSSRVHLGRGVALDIQGRALSAHVRSMVVEGLARHREAAVVHTEARLLQAGVIVLVDVRNGLLVAMLDCKESLF